MSFGIYKGKPVYMIHAAHNKETGDYQLPFICKLRNPIPSHYLDFLQRKVQEGWESLYLHICVEDMDTIWVRDRRTRRYQIQKGHLEQVLERFKQRVRLRLAMKKIRTQYRNRLLHEELVMKAWHPSRIQRLLDAGYDLDTILEC
jgi:hypothetical protein